MNNLSGSVGKNGANSPSDVLIVQRLINQCIHLIQTLAPLREDGRCGVLTINAITQFQRRIVKLKFPDGRVDPGGRTLKALNGPAFRKVSVPKSASPRTTDPGKTYTDLPNEVPAKKTKPKTADVVALIRHAWPDLNDNGAQTLAAQFIHETAAGRYCFNWNLGNVKSKTDQLHMYLRNVWEVVDARRAEGEVAKSGGLARIATEKEKKDHGWSCRPGQDVVVFSPPHWQCRFRAYASLEEGAQRWVAHHRDTIAKKHPEFLTHLNAGDVAAVANTLKDAGYFTANSETYARSMKAIIDKEFQTV